MPEPDPNQDPSYVAPTPVAPNLRTGGPSTPDVSVPNTTGAPEHQHPGEFTYQEMETWLRRQLGGDLWRLEGMNPDAVKDCIDDTLIEYGRRIPRLWYEMIDPGIALYEPKARAVLAVVRLDFIYPLSSTGGYGAAYEWNNNLNGVGLIPSTGPGLIAPAGDLMRFLMARKSFMRVASLTPQYHWDPSARMIHIYNTNKSYHSFALLTLSKTFAEINPNHKGWFRNHCLAKARYLLAENREKLDGAVQAPGGGTINVNSDRTMARAEKALEASTQALMDMQPRVIPIWGD